MSVWLPTGKKHAMAQIDLTSAPYTDHVRYLSYTVPPERDQVEVGTLLRRSLGLSAGLIKRVKWLTDGITLDGQRATTRTRAGAGQCLRIRLSDNVRSSDIPSSPGALDLLYEDEDLLVVNKAPGVAVHPGIGHWEHTLGSFLLYYYDAKGIPADFHPVHRLDKGTSGAMVVAKHSYAQELLRQALHSNAFDREYFAVCDGIPSPMQGTITFPLAHSGTSVIRQEIRPGASASENRAHPSNSGAYGSHRLSADRRFSLWNRKSRPDSPSRTAFLQAFLSPSPFEKTAHLYRSPPKGHGSFTDNIIKKPEHPHIKQMLRLFYLIAFNRNPFSQFFQCFS